MNLDIKTLADLHRLVEKFRLLPGQIIVNSGIDIPTGSSFKIGGVASPVLITLGDTRWSGTADTPLVSTAWDGDAFSTTAKTLIDLSAVFGAPAGIKAIVVNVAVRDSGASGATDCMLRLGSTNTAGQGVPFACFPVDSRWNRVGGITVACDANGDVYYQVVASGVGTLECVMTISGYYI